MKTRILTALPVYNEVSHVADVLTELKQHVNDILVVDDGSSDGTAEVLKQIPGICVERHPRNLGYGAALNTAFQYALEHGFDVLVTMDCDGQHQPRFVREIASLIDESSDTPIDMVSGSRYLKDFEGDNAAPADRRAINKRITECLNEKLGLSITDSFCGFKAYRVPSLAKLDITDNGYAMPLQLWIQAVDLNWNIREFAVPRVYLEEARSFGGSLDDANVRLAHYRSVLNAELERRGMDQRFTSDCGRDFRSVTTMTARFDQTSLMQLALQQARMGEGLVEPNPMVGAVVATAVGDIISTGYHRRFGEAHAEVNAIAEAGSKTIGNDLYVTLEPCSHFGKTPPCADAVIRAGIRRVIIGCKDPAPHVAGQGIQRLRDAGVEVTVGVCEAEAKRLIAPFEMLMLRKRPWIHAKWAMTLDGPNCLADWSFQMDQQRCLARHRASTAWPDGCHYHGSGNGAL